MRSGKRARGKVHCIVVEPSILCVRMFFARLVMAIIQVYQTIHVYISKLFSL